LAYALQWGHEQLLPDGRQAAVQGSPTVKLREWLGWAEISHKLKRLYKREAMDALWQEADDGGRAS